MAPMSLELLGENEVNNAWRRFTRRWDTLVDRANDFAFAVDPLKVQVALIVEVQDQYWLYSSSKSDEMLDRVINVVSYLIVMYFI